MNWNDLFSYILKKDILNLEQFLKDLPTDWNDSEPVPHDKYGNTPLYWAIKQGLIEKIPLFWEKRFHPLNKNRDGNWAMSALLENRNQEMISIVVKKLQNESTQLPTFPADSHGNTLLHKWIESEEEDLCNHLFDQIPITEWSRENNDNDTPFFRAIALGLDELVIKIFKLYPSSWEWTNSEGMSFIHILSMYNCKDLAIRIKNEYSLNWDKYKDATDSRGNNAIHHAAENDAVELLPVLLESEIEPLLLNKESESPLLIADREKFHHVIKILKKYTMEHLGKIKKKSLTEFDEKISLLKREGIFRAEDFYLLEKE